MHVCPACGGEVIYKGAFSSETGCAKRHPERDTAIQNPGHPSPQVATCDIDFGDRGWSIIMDTGDGQHVFMELGTNGVFHLFYCINGSRLEQSATGEARAPLMQKAASIIAKMIHYGSI